MGLFDFDFGDIGSFFSGPSSLGFDNWSMPDLGSVVAPAPSPSFLSSVGDFLTPSAGGWMDTVGKLAPIASFGQNVASTLLNHQALSQQYSRTSDAINRSEAENRAALMERDQQQRAASREDIGQRAREAMIEKSRMRALQAEMGAGGNTAQRLIQSVDFGAGSDIAMLEGNSEAASRQLAREVARAEASANRERSQLTKPSAFSTGLGLVKSGIGLVQDMRGANPARSAGLQVSR